MVSLQWRSKVVWKQHKKLHVLDSRCSISGRRPTNCLHKGVAEP